MNYKKKCDTNIRTFIDTSYYKGGKKKTCHVGIQKSCFFLSVLSVCRSAPPAPLRTSPELHCDVRVSNFTPVRGVKVVSETKTRHKHTVAINPSESDCSDPQTGCTSGATFLKLCGTFDPLNHRFT